MGAIYCHGNQSLSNLPQNPMQTFPSPNGAQWLSGRASDIGARGQRFETYLRPVVILSKTLYSLKVLVNRNTQKAVVPSRHD